MRLNRFSKFGQDISDGSLHWRQSFEWPAFLLTVLCVFIFETIVAMLLRFTKICMILSIMHVYVWFEFGNLFWSRFYVNCKCYHIELISAQLSARFAYFFSFITGVCAKAIVTQLFLHFAPAKNVQLDKNMTRVAVDGLIED